MYVVHAASRYNYNKATVPTQQEKGSKDSGGWQIGDKGLNQTAERSDMSRVWQSRLGRLVLENFTTT